MKLLQMRSHADASPLDSASAAEPTEISQIWATEGNLARAVQALHARGETDGRAKAKESAASGVRVVLAPQTAFYRRYTEGMLRRYAVLALEGGRVPSLLGREMFRGKVTSYRVHAFDDVVIFVHDVEQCMRTLTLEQQRLLLRISIQEYTFSEVATGLGISIRSVQRRYTEALDELTAVFLERRLLERIACDPCQGADPSARVVSHCPA